MILKELINKHPWDNISPRLLEIHPNEKDSLDGYQYTYEIELNKEPAENKDNLFIDIAYIEEDKESGEDSYYSVNGISEEDTKKEDNFDNGFAIEFLSFEEWLGLGITESILNNYSEIDIICHCLWEMTFTGFTTRQKQEEKDKLDEAIKEVDEIIENEEWDRLIEIDLKKEK